MGKYLGEKLSSGAVSLYSGGWGMFVLNSNSTSICMMNQNHLNHNIPNIFWIQLIYFKQKLIYKPYQPDYTQKN